MSGRKKIGSSRMNPEDSAVLTGERRGNRERALLPVRRQPASDPVQAIVIKPAENRGPRNNHGANHHRVPSARNRSSNGRPQRADDRGQTTDDRKQFRILDWGKHRAWSIEHGVKSGTMECWKDGIMG